MNKRPNPNESEDDILKQEKEFLRQSLQPAAKVVKNDDLASKISNAPIQTETTNDDDNMEIETSLIGNIIERKINEVIDIEMTAKYAKGFPQAKRRETSGIPKKGSIFSQQNAKQKQETNETLTESSEVSSLMSSSQNIELPSKSYILTGEDSQQIHSENIKVLSKMSKQEILEEQKRLLSSLDSNLIELLKFKRKMGLNVPVDSMEVEVAQEAKEGEANVSIEEIDTPKEIIDSTEKCVHFDVIETEKFQWMKDVEIPVKKDGKAYEARFDFNGLLQPFTDEDISESNRSLYHHGEEPGRPGYSLKELFKLCRSNVLQQRILALNTISNITSLYVSGIYDDILDLPLEQIFFVVRLCLDENAPNILNASLKTMHSIFVYKKDEKCLDWIQGFGYAMIQPMLTVDKETNDSDKDREINDQQLAELDLVKCLVRTDILERIRYIINTIKPNTETIVYCIEILIRIMRDSQKIAVQAYYTEDLFKSVIKHFVPKIYKQEDPSENCYGKPVLQAIKLIRVAACRSKTIAEDLIKRHNIMDSIMSYVSNEIYVKIQAESFKLLAVFFRYNLGIGYISDLQPCILRYLDYHYKKTNSDSSMSYNLQTHFAGLMDIISEISRIGNVNLLSNFIPILMQCLTKYCAQIETSIGLMCGQMQMASSIIVTLTNIVRDKHIEKRDEIEKTIFKLVSSSGFDLTCTNIMNSSNLLCEYDPHKTSNNFISLEVTVRCNREKIIPILNSNSCIPFLVSLSHFIVNSENTELINEFIGHPMIHNYLLAVKTDNLRLTNNWFTKYESQLIINILKCTVKLQNQLWNLFTYYELTVKCLSTFTIEQKSDIDFLVKNIVFNKKYYPTELLLKEMNITDNTEEILNITSYLNEIYDCYSAVMGLKQKQFLFDTSLTLDIRIGNIIPIDWIYSPIIDLYSKFEENTLKTTDEKGQISIVTRCLQCIVLYELYFPTLSSLINTTDRFCRLSCIYLCSNSLFLDEDVHNLLEKCFKVLIKKENFEKIDFDKPIQGLNNFQDFYVQLLEQYQGVSYGDILFANFIMVPLAQRHNVKWRKMLWSEYMGAAQSITIDPNQCLIDVEEFLEPPENDVSIFKCYRRALASGQLKRNPLLKHIANFHVDNFVKNKKLVK